jgi:group II intron reverse transcriptase/maturase
MDGMSTAELRPWLARHWGEVRKALDAGTYRPAPFRRVMIPKPDGGERELGVPTVLDRLIQQAVAQVLTPIFDPGFSESSFGFRPGRGAHQAVEAARTYVAEGYKWVINVDLERFFDRVQHDALMARVARKVADRRLLRLIRRYLEAGVLVEGVKQAGEEGTPQGSPISPLLSNIMLDDLDRELERRGHRFVRYADDIRIHVRSERAGKRVLAGIADVLRQRLKLRVNEAKSSVRHAARAVLLGFGFVNRGSRGVGIRVDPKALEKMRRRVRRLTSRAWSIPMERRIGRLNRYIAGWSAYFGLADTGTPFEFTDKWLRRRLRQVRWREWKRPAARRENLRRLGLRPDTAERVGGYGRGHWHISGSTALQQALPNAYWDRIGLVGFSARWHRCRPA